MNSECSGPLPDFNPIRQGAYLSACFSEYFLFILLKITAF